MATTYKVLGQSNPLALTDTTLYTVPAATQTVASTLVIANIGVVSDSFRVAVRVNGEALSAKQYLTYNTAIAVGDTKTLTLGLTLGAGDIVTVRAGTTGLAFNLFRSELS